ncbi:Ethylene-responsive transcription factor ERF017 [Linum perenne]
MVKQSPPRETETDTERHASELKFKGVRKRKWGKWVSEIRLPNSRERIWLGSYDSPEKAARAFDAALFCLRGPTAKLNFPDNPPDHIPPATSLSREQIQEAAVRFANSESNSISTTNHRHSELQQVESPCPSSDVESVQVDGSELALDDSFLDELANMGSGSGTFPTDYGIFPGFDDLCNDYFAQNATFNYQEDQTSQEEEFLGHDSFLWNF